MLMNHRGFISCLIISFSLMIISSCSADIDGVPSVKKLNRPFGSHDRSGFLSPEKVHYPETWFHFIGSNVSLEGITADLEAIAGTGISGVQFFHGQFGDKWPETGEGIAPLSENWDDAVRHIASECQRLGLRFTIQNCPGWAMSGGPWIKPENAMRGLVSSRTDFTGNNIETMIPRPQPSDEPWRDYHDIAVLAFPTPEGDTGKAIGLKSIKGSGNHPWEALMRGEMKHISLAPSGEDPYTIDVVFDAPSVIRTFEFPCINHLNHSMCFEPGVKVTAYAITADGKHHKITDAHLPQSNWQDHDPISFACPEVKDAVGCRIEISNRFKMDLHKINLYSAARKNSWESEAGLTLRSFERTADDVVQSESAYIAHDEIIDISDKLSSDGYLRWSPPHEGPWTILRIGHVNEGKKNAPAPPEGTGWECDKLSTDGPEAHFAGYVGRLADGPLQGGLLDGMLLDSWECRTQMWTRNMEDEFSARCGYDLRSWLPALFGHVIDMPETTSRFLLDWRGTVGHLFADRFYKRMAELGHSKGLTVTYETAAGDVFPADIMEYFKYADVPMCEFWQPYNEHGYVGSLNFKPIKPTASAAHLYGKPRVAAESFTSFALTWNESLEFLKEYADYHFIEGVTHNVFHTYTHNPQIGFLPPGSSMGRDIGTPFLRGQTWWPYMKEFTTYLARCSYMLERGRPVSDVLWYLGDEISHKPDQEYPFPAGYRYDYCNPDILLNRLSVKEGRIITPEGLSYAMLWIPENKRMKPETLQRLHFLISEGAAVAAEKPQYPATLVGGEQTETDFHKLVDSIWGDAASGDIIVIGKGRLYCGTDIAEALEIFSVRPDVKGDVRWLHRETKGADWYFVTPEKSSSFKGKVAFAAEGAAELWNPVTGEMSPLEIQHKNGYAEVELDLPQGGSCFIVFDNNRRHENPLAQIHDTAHDISGPWTISFPDGWGAPQQIETAELKPWCELPISDEGKAFSGKATYSTTLSVNSEHIGKSAILDLGKVYYVAEVTINGKQLPALWCSPYIIEIGEHLTAGENNIEIAVTSTWHNRLAYDASLPENERKTWTINGPAEGTESKHYGLMGPVAIRFEK